jgi:hypothetical protein
MNMNRKPRHTEILETLATEFGTVVREDNRNHPNSEPNLYMLSSEGKVVWFAERKLENDAYPNQIIRISPEKIKCFSAMGLECEIDLRTGKILSAELTR